MDLVVTEKVSRYYTDGTTVRAVDRIDFRMGPGEFTCLVGPSGSGKTTFLNLIGGIDRPTAGRVWFEGREISSLPEKERARVRLHRMGFVFQSYNLIPVLSAFENVELVLLLQKVPREERRRRVLRLFAELGLEELADRLPPQMSGGQQQRVAVARAIVHEPRLVLADEPTANLDTENALALVELMRRLCEEKGISFLLATHDARVMERAQRVVRIIDGKLVDA